jgi:glucose-1-phosphate thymidylyltransferase
VIFNCFKGKDKIKPSKRGEYEILEPYKWLIKKKYRVDTIEYDSKWLDPGKFNDWIEANQYLLDINNEGEIKSRVDKKTSIQGRVGIGTSCNIKSSEIRGPVVIGDSVFIDNSYVGPYTSVSNNCIIQNSHVENSVLMDGVQIKNIKQPINESLVGTQAEVCDEDGPTDWIKLFIGEKSRVKI